MEHFSVQSWKSTVGHNDQDTIPDLIDFFQVPCKIALTRLKDLDATSDHVNEKHIWQLFWQRNTEHYISDEVVAIIVYSS